MSLAQRTPNCPGELRNTLTKIYETFFYTLPYICQRHQATTFAVLIGKYPVKRPEVMENRIKNRNSEKNP